MLFSQNSQLLLRHSKYFKNRKVFFSGNIEDNFPAYLLTNNTRINFLKYSNYLSFKQIKNIKKINIYNNLLVSKNMIKDCDTIVYYWPKSKSEAKFQLINILSSLSVKTEIFIVGNNSSGIKSAFTMLDPWIQCKKIDNAKHSILILGSVKRKKVFILEDFFKIHYWKNIAIKSLPGVFGYKKIDRGSLLLASTFSKNITGQVLDVGCGAGFLSMALLYYSKNINLTLLDNSISALVSSQSTFNFNQKIAEFIISDCYLNVSKKFDFIISNPPFHEDLKINFNLTKKIICDSAKYLTHNGEFRFVTNIYFNCDALLKKIFKKYVVLTKNNQYKVCQAFLN